MFYFAAVVVVVDEAAVVVAVVVVVVDFFEAAVVVVVDVELDLSLAITAAAYSSHLERTFAIRLSFEVALYSLLSLILL